MLTNHKGNKGFQDEIMGKTSDKSDQTQEKYLPIIRGFNCKICNLKNSLITIPYNRKMLRISKANIRLSFDCQNHSIFHSLDHMVAEYYR